MRYDRYPDTRDTFTILGIDPGSETLGYGVIEAKINTLEIVNAEAFTVIGSKSPYFCISDSALVHDRYARINAHKETLLHILNTYDPLAVSCESPFFNMRRPNAFGVLMEVLTAIQDTVVLWDPWKPVLLVDPPTAKKSFGAPGNADKSKMAEAFGRLPQLHYPGTQCLDEHSIDGLAMAYHQYCIYTPSRL